MNIAQELYEKRASLMLKPNGTFRLAVIVLLLIGLASLIGGFAAETTRVRTWASLLLANFFLFSISMGGVVFGMIQELVGATWSRPIKRIHEGFGSFLPVSVGIFLIMFVCIRLRLLGAGELYSWIADPQSIHHFWGKNVWLSENFMLIRDTFAMFTILAIAFWYYSNTVKRDLRVLKQGLSASRQESEMARARLRFWAAPLLFLTGCLYSMLAFDLTMSLAPTWFSTLWGGWSFAITMQTLMATTLIFMFTLKSRTFLGEYIQRQQFHDVGKLMHGFTVFFAYLTYAHVLTYWYANMPETSEYYIHRLQQPWLTLVIIAPFLNFVFPLFALIPKPSKWTAGITIPIAAVILSAQWLTYIIVVVPNVVKGDGWNGPWLEAGVFAGILGFFLCAYGFFASRVPMIGIGDPLLPEAYEAH